MQMRAERVNDSARPVFFSETCLAFSKFVVIAMLIFAPADGPDRPLSSSETRNQIFGGRPFLSFRSDCDDNGGWSRLALVLVKDLEKTPQWTGDPKATISVQRHSIKVNESLYFSVATMLVITARDGGRLGGWFGGR